MPELTTVCDRCGSTDCVGLEVCALDGLPHDTVEVPTIKLVRQEHLDAKALAAAIRRANDAALEAKIQADAARAAEAALKEASRQNKGGTEDYATGGIMPGPIETKEPKAAPEKMEKASS